MSQSHAHPQPSNYRIPGDILLQVFEELSGRSTGQWEPAPWTLAVVCRHWRDLVILSPALWSQLTFSPNNQPSSMLERFEVQLSRAGTCPLELKIDVVPVAPVDPQEALQTAFRLLVANIGRCTRLELGGQAPLCWSLASSIEGTPSLPILQSLSILHRSWISAPKGSPARSSQSPVRLFFRNTPSLRSIVLHGGNFLHPTFSQDFQLDNVERLILRHCHFDPASILPLLETSAPHLRELTIEHGSPLQHGSPEQAIELPQLRRVSLVHLYSEPPLMDHVRTPNLQYARLTGVSTCQRDTLALLNSVLASNSATNIRELVFEVCLYEMCTPLLGLLEELKGLDTLIIRQVVFGGGSDPLLNGLRLKSQASPPSSLESKISHPTSPKICPRLRKLELSYITVDARLLEDMARSRIPPSYEGYSPLRELFLYNITLKESDGGGDLQWLQDIVQQGCLKASDREIWVV